MIYITGDTHGDFRRFSARSFPEQAAMTRSDCVIVCGDFGGVWREPGNAQDRYWLDWLEGEKPFTLLFVDGNHENFDRLLGDEFPREARFGGEVARLRENVFYLPRGQVLTLEGKRFFAFGGARSHDIEDGILDPAEAPDPEAFRRTYRRWRALGRKFRVKGTSWWPEELPDEADMARGLRALAAVNFEVDYVITHCLPHDVAFLLGGTFEPDRLTLYFNDLMHRGLRFDGWYCGHYHTERTLMGRFHVLYGGVERLI